MQAVVSHEAITDCLKDSRFKGKYILVLPEELSSLIDWDGQDHHTRKGLLQKSDMVFSSNPKTRAWCLGQPPYNEGVNSFLDEFKTLKPCIHGSDCARNRRTRPPLALRGLQGHVCGLGAACHLRHCWIKADPTFEGLKQLLYEPADRVIIQEADPTPIKSNYTLHKFSISGAKISDDLSIHPTALGMNPGLVAVTGGKGSGKTAFVDLIANCYKDRCNTEDPNSFVHRISDENPAIDTSLEFKDGNVFKKAVSGTSFFEDSEIVYIAQGELENYIGADSGLDIYIRNLIFESPQVKDTVINFDFDELLAAIETLQDRIAKKNEAIATLEKETSKEGLEAIKLEAKQKEAERKDADQRLQELEKAQSKEKIALAQKKQEAIAALKLKKDSLVQLKTVLAEAIDFLDDDVGAFNEKIALINKLLVDLELEERFDALSYPQKDQLNKRLIATKAELTKVVADIESAQKQLETFEADVKAHAKLLEKKRELDSELAALKVRQEELVKKGEGLAQAVSDRRGLVKQLVQTIIAQKTTYEDIISEFSAQKAEVLADLSFSAHIGFDRARFLQMAEDVLDNRRVTVSNKEKGGATIFDDLFAVIDSLIAGTDLNADKYAGAIEHLAAQNKGKLKPSQAITVADFYAFLYDNYFAVIPTVRYKGIQLSKLSLGQKATVLIKIYLAQGDKPIIIDSHDDHLDNEFIMEELVKAIRQAKTYRQVILASNNGNVVINSDAEQIIIASRDANGLISYMSGSIENPRIHSRAVEVLEGGSDAFRQRQQKYRIGS